MLAAPPSNALQAAAWLIQANPEASALLDLSQASTPVVWVNAAFAALCRVDAELVLPTTSPAHLPTLLGIDDAHPDWLGLLTQLASGLPGQLQCRAYRQQHEAFWADISAYRLPAAVAGAKSPPALAVVTVRDHSAAWLTSKALRRQTRHSDALLNVLTDAVLQADSALVLNALNPAAQTLTGWRVDEATGRPVVDVVQLVDSRAGTVIGNPLLSTLLTGETIDWTDSAVLCRPDGSQTPVTYRTAVVRDDDGAVVEGLLLMRSAAEATVLADTLTHLAGHDALTNLPNRSVFDDRFEQALALAQRHKHQCAMLLITVSNHPHTVAHFGKAAGDALLQTVALRLPTAFRRSDTVYRIDDARFAVVFPLVTDTATGEVLMAKAQSVTHSPAPVEAHKLCAELSIGGAIFPRDGATAVDLFHHAAAQL